MNYLGDFAVGQTVFIPFQTFNSAGASVTLTDLAVTDIEVYKNGSIVQRASDSGYVLLDTDGVNFDGLVGLHGFSINLADNTTADFYQAGNDYMVAVSSVTVDGQVLNFWAASFSIQNRYMRGTDSAALASSLVTVAENTDQLETGQGQILDALESLNNISVTDILNGVIEGAVTLKQSLQISNAALGGKVSGTDTSTVSFRDLADTKDRLVATVTDTGNRTAVTKDYD